MRIRWLTAVTAMVAMTLVGAASARAEPAPFEWINVTCPGWGERRMVSPGGDGLSFTPGFLTGTDALLVPYEVTLTVSVNGDSTTDHIAKRSPMPDDAVTCTLSRTLRFGTDTYVLAGTIVGVVRGRPQ